MKRLPFAIVMIGLMTFTSIAWAQPGPKSDRVESLRVAFITEKLNLMPEEAKEFWPLYNEYQEKLDGLHPEREERGRPDYSTMSDEEVEQTLEQEMIRKRKHLELQEEYVDKFKKVLPVRKVAMFMHLDREFKLELMRRMREHRFEDGPREGAPREGGPRGSGPRGDRGGQGQRGEGGGGFGPGPFPQG